MVPPPGSTGDEFPDFDKMTFEEQMAWLESLAKRQGAREEELTTAANVDVPVPEDAEIDEPGYVPFEGSRSAREAKEGKSAAPVQEPQPPVQQPAPAESQASAPADDFQVLDWETAEAAVEKAVNPMQWLDSLTAQPGEDLGSLFAGAGVQESEDLGEFADLFSGLEAETPELPLEPEPELSVENAALEPGAEPSVDDLLGGMDPMRWLESLAARQGASKDELTTSADLDIEIPEDTEIDEPGYVPFEGSRSAREWGKPVEPEPEPEPEVPVEPIFEELAPSPELELAWEPSTSEPEIDFETSADFFEPTELPEPAGADELGELLGGADPMTWLESLARRTGANPEELMTAADLSVPELPEDTVVDEPGYVPYSAFDIRPSASAEAAKPPRVELPEPEPVDEFAVEAELESLDESLSWLEDLAAEPAEGLSGYLAVEEELAETPVAEIEVEPEPPAPVAGPSAADPLAGMTDEDIAYAQAKGLLTGPQELAWLKRQAAKLAETRQSQEADEVAPELVEPAELVSELPDWLQGMRPEAEGEVETPQALIEEFSLLSESPDWLSETSPEAESALADMASVTAELSLDEDVEQLWAEETPEEAPVLESELIPDSELAAFLRGDLSPEAPDLLAEALDAEYDRRVEGDESEPSWYTDAVAKAAAEAPAIQDAELQAPAPAEEEPVLSEPESLDMPGWLMESEAGIEEPALSSDMPAWLLEETPAVEVEGGMPAWMSESEVPLPLAEPAEAMPDWLTAFDQPETSEVGWIQEVSPVAEVEEAQPVAEIPPQPELEPVKPEPTPVPAPKAAAPPEVPAKPAPAPIPEGELFDQYRRRLELDPDDHVNRLALARALHGGRALVPSLEQYETLIDSAQLLPDVADDLSSLAEDYPEVPRVRRLLGDVYMRRGMLQEALNAYRSALEQL